MIHSFINQVSEVSRVSKLRKRWGTTTNWELLPYTNKALKW